MTWWCPQLSLYSSSSSTASSTFSPLFFSTCPVQFPHASSKRSIKKTCMNLELNSFHHHHGTRWEYHKSKSPSTFLLSTSFPFLPLSSPAWTSHHGFSFEADHLCHPHCQLAERAPHFFYKCTHTQRCRAGMLSPSPQAMQLANPWTESVKNLHKIAKFNYKQHTAPPQTGKHSLFCGKSVILQDGFIKTICIQHHNAEHVVCETCGGWETLEFKN